MSQQLRTEDGRKVIWKVTHPLPMKVCNIGCYAVCGFRCIGQDDGGHAAGASHKEMAAGDGNSKAVTPRAQQSIALGGP
jgi:hypothetical protein